MQKIWDEVGETDEERDKMLLQLEHDCLDVYKRKVDQAVKSRAHLLQTLADARVVLTNLLSALGEKTYDEIVSNYFFRYMKTNYISLLNSVNDLHVRNSICITENESILLE